MKKQKPNKSEKYHQGRYDVINKEKYIGDYTRVIFRSSWEFKFCYFLDTNERIRRWACEYIVIPYQDLKGKFHRYNTDFYIEVYGSQDSNSLKKIVIEVKPYKEYHPDFIRYNEDGSVSVLPLKSNTLKALKSRDYQINTYKKNRLKWEQAKEFCRKNGMEFHVLTEKYFDDKKVKLF